MNGKKEEIMPEENFVDNPDSTITLTDQNMAAAVARYPFIVVDCWAEWCGPCKMIGPILENMAKKHKGEIVFGKLDVDKNPDTAKNYSIRSIPNLLVFKNGQKVGDIVGALPEAKLLERINALKG
jgi:thioredoxin 1